MGAANPDFVPRPPVKIGLLNPMTGPIAVYSPPFTIAAQMAIDDLNAAGGNFELVEADSGRPVPSGRGCCRCRRSCLLRRLDGR